MDTIMTMMVSPQPQLTSTSTGKASIPLTAADKTQASMGGIVGESGGKGNEVFSRPDKQKRHHNFT